VEGEPFCWPLRGIIWFTIAIIGSCTVIALLTGYVQKTRSFEKVSHHVEAVTPSITAMSVRDLLTFNLFLQLTDGLVSYQSLSERRVI
jgi:hypothetical protein